jgi:predicted Zn-dependent protease
LHIDAGEVANLIVAVDALRLHTGGFDGRQWRLEWQADHAVAAIAFDADSLDTGSLPPTLARQVERARADQRRRRVRLRLAIGLALLVLALPVLLLGVFWWQADPIAGWAASQVGTEQEARLGDRVFAQMRPALKLVETGPALDAVRGIGMRLTRGSAYRYDWHLADDPAVNAFALPGGHVVVFTGLLRATGSAEELAGVLAHEAQHIEQRHSLKNLLHGLGWRALLGLALGDLSGSVWAGLAEQMGSLGYSRELEVQADAGGLLALRRAGISPDGMLRFFARLEDKDAGQIELLSTHPASAHRRQALERAIAAQGRAVSAALPYDWPALQRALHQPVQ